jgi:hypothetical protein
MNAAIESVTANGRAYARPSAPVVVLCIDGCEPDYITQAIQSGVVFLALASGYAGENSAPVFVKEIPPGYRDWRLISVAREEGDLDDIRAILGNDIAVKAYREQTLPFPDGTVIARLAWSFVASEENIQAFGRVLSFVAGHPKNGVQFMIRDAKKYAVTGGWGYALFDDGLPAQVAFMLSCFPCHREIKSRDFIFTRYAP